MSENEMTPPKGLSDKDMAPYGWTPKPCSFCNGLGTESNGGICGVCDGTKLLDHPISAEDCIADLRDQLAEANAWRDTLWGLIDPCDLNPNKPMSPELVAALLRSQRAAAQAALRRLRQDLEASEQRERELQAKYDDLSALLTIYCEMTTAMDEARDAGSTRILSLYHNPARREMADSADTEA